MCTDDGEVRSCSYPELTWEIPLEKVSFLPVLVDRQAQPEVVRRKDRGFDDVLSYMKAVTQSQRLNAR